MGLALTRAVEEGVLHRDQKGHYYLPDYQPGGLHNRLPPGASSAAAIADGFDEWAGMRSSAVADGIAEE